MTRSVLLVSASLFLVTASADAAPTKARSFVTGKDARETKPPPKSTTLGKTGRATTTRNAKAIDLRKAKTHVYADEIQKSPSPMFKALLSNASLQSRAKSTKLVAHSASSATTTLATLSAGKPRDGVYSMDFRCGFVFNYQAVAPDGFALWPNHLIEHCRGRVGADPGVEVTFAAEAGRAYAVTCSSATITRFQIRHKLGDGEWSPTASVTTRDPVDFVIADSAGEARVRFVFDPEDNNVLEQAIRQCKVSRVG